MFVEDLTLPTELSSLKLKVEPMHMLLTIKNACDIQLISNIFTTMLIFENIL